jgi:SAM-dependent methyltransferase
MSEDAYGSEYFAQRSHDDPRRAIMGEQEFKRVITRTGLDGGVALDIGCGLGEFLERFPTARWQRFGIEVSAYARGVCEAKAISFELPEGDGWCDLIVLRGSLQHLDRPIETLARAHDWLRPGGWLVILATPNAGGPVYRLFQELPALAPTLNFVVFSDKELRQCLHNLDFEAVEIVYPYLETPYASPVKDITRFALRLFGVRRPFAFWRNMMECYARRG